MSDKIQAVVIGATGYVGGELLRLISMHPDLQLAAAISASRAGDGIAACFPHLSVACAGKTFVSHTEWLESIAPGSRLAMFSAAPHGASAGVIKAALEAAEKADMKVHVVDSSADFRFSSLTDFESIYGVKHGAPELMSRFQCGVPEHVSAINTPHIAHPGCFATAILLAAVPLLSSATTDGELFVTGITGSTGSGKRPQPGTHHPERHSNLYAYKPLTHRHTAEIVRLANTASGKEARILPARRLASISYRIPGPMRVAYT